MQRDGGTTSTDATADVVQALRREIHQLKEEVWEAHHGRRAMTTPIHAAPEHRSSRIPTVQRRRLAKSGSSTPNLHAVVLATRLAASLASPAASASERMLSPSRLQLPSIVPTFPSFTAAAAAVAFSQAVAQPRRMQTSASETALRREPSTTAETAPLRVRKSRHQTARLLSQERSSSSLETSTRPSSHQREAMEHFLAQPEPYNEKLARAFSHLRYQPTNSPPYAACELPPAVADSLRAWPFDLLRRLFAKVCTDTLTLKERVVDATKQCIVARTTLMAAQAAASETSTALSSATTTEAPLLVIVASATSLQQKIQRRFAFKRALVEVVRSTLLDRAARTNEEVDPPGSIPANARQIVAIEYRSFRVALTRLERDETESRKEDELLLTREALHSMDRVLQAQEALALRPGDANLQSALVARRAHATRARDAARASHALSQPPPPLPPSLADLAQFQLDVNKVYDDATASSTKPGRSRLRAPKNETAGAGTGAPAAAVSRTTQPAATKLPDRSSSGIPSPSPSTPSGLQFPRLLSPASKIPTPTSAALEAKSNDQPLLRMPAI